MNEVGLFMVRAIAEENNHPNFVSRYNLGKVNRRGMKSLGLLEELEMKDAEWIMTQIMDVLSFLHGFDISFRFSAENLFVNFKDKEIAFLDFEVKTRKDSILIARDDIMHASGIVYGKVLPSSYLYDPVCHKHFNVLRKATMGHYNKALTVKRDLLKK